MRKDRYRAGCPLTVFVVVDDAVRILSQRCCDILLSHRQGVNRRIRRKIGLVVSNKGTCFARFAPRE